MEEQLIKIAVQLWGGAYMWDESPVRHLNQEQQQLLLQRALHEDQTLLEYSGFIPEQ